VRTVFGLGCDIVHPFAVVILLSRFRDGRGGRSLGDRAHRFFVNSDKSLPKKRCQKRLHGSLRPLGFAGGIAR